MPLEVKAEIPWTKVRSFTDGNPWCIAFVYPRKDKAFIVKGGFIQVQEWVKSNGIKRALIHYTMFGHNNSIDGGFPVKTNRSSISVLTGSDTVKAYVRRIGLDRVTNKKPPKNRRWHLLVFTIDGKPHPPVSSEGSTMVLNKRFRRPPRCWPKELDQFVLTAEEVAVTGKPVKPSTSIAKPKPFVSKCTKCKHAIKDVKGVSVCKLSRYAEQGQNCPLNDSEQIRNPEVATIVATKSPMPWKGVVAESKEAANGLISQTTFSTTIDFEDDGFSELFE